MYKLFSVCLLFISWAIAQDTSTLKVVSSPDSALVYLDGSDTPEPIKTPYENNQMIPGQHQVRLEGASPIYHPANLTLNLKREETVELSHSFSYRNKSFLNEGLPVAPGHLSTEIGFQGLSSFAYYKQEMTASEGTVTATSHRYGEKNPASMLFPLTVRAGFPADFELSLTLPFARKNFGDSTADFGMGNVVIGSKFLIRPIQSAIGIDYSISGSDPGQLGVDYPSLGVHFSSLFDIKGFLLQSNLKFRYNFERDNYTPGNDFEAYLEAGYPISLVRPLIGFWAIYHNSDAIDTLDLKNAAYEVRVRPGAILEVGNSTYLQLGIPVSLPFLGKNRDMVWGVELSFKTDFKLWDAPSSKQSPEAKEASQTTSAASPIKGEVFVLLSQTEVTNKQYREFLTKTGASTPEDPGFANMPNYFSDPQYDDYPVVGVSFNAAQQYAAWAGKRLPKQSEWLSAISTLNIQSTDLACGIDAPTPVRAKHQGNQLFNVVGNVSEWIENDNTTANGPKMNAGGSFNIPVERCMNPEKLIDFSAGKGSKYIGFRVIDEIK